MSDNTALDDNRLLLDDGDEIPLVASSTSSVQPAPAAKRDVPRHVTAVPASQPDSTTRDTSSLLTETPAEQREIVSMGQSISTAQPSDTTSLDDAVNQAVAGLGLTLSDPDIARRFHVLVSMYFRDLRDRLETKSKFTMPVTSGGMGMSDPDAEKAMDILAEKVSAYHMAPAARVVQEKSTYVTTQAEKHLSDDQVRTDREQVELERAYSSLLSKTGLAAPQAAAPVARTEPRVIPVVAVRSAVSVSVAAPQPTLRAPAAAAPAPVAILQPEYVPPNLPVAPIEAPAVGAAGTPSSDAVRVVPATNPPTVSSTLASSDAAPAAPTAPAPVLVAASVVVPSVATRPTGALPENAKVEETSEPMAPTASRTAFEGEAPRGARRPVETPSAPMPAVSARPTMTDVQSTPRLTGPVDELRQLNVEDFRRLSKDPKEATLKIKDKVDLLDELGFETKAQGIKAFLESPVNRLYLDVLRASLEGKPVVEVIAVMEARGTPVLNKQEFDAMMDINRWLRFG